MSLPSLLNIWLILYLLRQNSIKHHLTEKEGSHFSRGETPVNSVSQTKQENGKCQRKEQFKGPYSQDVFTSH